MAKNSLYSTNKPNQTNILNLVSLRVATQMNKKMPRFKIWIANFFSKRTSSTYVHVPNLLC